MVAASNTTTPLSAHSTKKHNSLFLSRNGSLLRQGFFQLDSVRLCRSKISTAQTPFPSGSGSGGGAFQACLGSHYTPLHCILQFSILHRHNHIVTYTDCTLCNNERQVSDMSLQNIQTVVQSTTTIRVKSRRDIFHLLLDVLK
jgi:hypothetical protein